MTTIARTFARYIALPVVSAGIIGAAALGMAGMANAATSVPSDPQPGARWHHGMHHLAVLQPSAVA
jgi:hypothetical protein